MVRTPAPAEDDVQSTVAMIRAVGTIIGFGLLGLAFKAGFLERDPNEVVFGALVFAGFVVLGQAAFMTTVLRTLAQHSAALRRLEARPGTDVGQQRETAA